MSDLFPFFKGEATDEDIAEPDGEEVDDPHGEIEFNGSPDIDQEDTYDADITIGDGEPSYSATEESRIDYMLDKAMRNIDDDYEMFEIELDDV